jgi:hypothetical protein
MFGLLLLVSLNYRARSTYLSVYPPGCDIEAALVCEKSFLNCKLFTGPADDPKTLVRVCLKCLSIIFFIKCTCGEQFYGDCLRRAGVSEINSSIQNEMTFQP